MNYIPTLLCDFYKVSHKAQYPKGTEYIYSTWTPRSNKYMPRADKVVMFGLQAFIKKYLIDFFDKNFFSRAQEAVVGEYRRYIKYTLGVENPDASHIRELHSLGYLPIEIRALPEGTLVPIRVPMFTVENTRPDLVDSFWVTNYLETIMSAEIWQPMTSATIAYEYRKILNKYADLTGANPKDIDFQAHDFSMRGMAGLDAAAASGAGHLLSFTGTDTIPAIMFHEMYYNANIEKELVGASIPATEHSVMCANGTDELEVFKRLITEVYPEGFVSIVSDTWDFWGIIENVIPQLKEDILKRNGRVVIRPDSGDPVEILCGREIPQYDSIKDAIDMCQDAASSDASESCGDHETGYDEYEYIVKVEDKYYKLTFYPFYNRYDKRYYYVDGWDREEKVEEITPNLADIGLIEALWNIFGGTYTDKGFKQLDSHIGAIYGDSITLERCEEICKRLHNKGFSSTNVVFGVGSYTYQYNTRDVFGFAMKATWAQINGEEKLLYKDPKTDSGLKKSQKGRVVVIEDGYNGELTYLDNLTFKEWVDFQDKDVMRCVFKNGELLIDESLSNIRKRLFKNG